MDGKSRGVWARRWAALTFGMLAWLAAPGAFAADCPGHPDALGTSRILVVDPKDHPRIGTMQYPETLPLADHEVVLTFDDGPLPRNSNQVLDILASQCVKATFFEIGQMAHSYPEGVRKLRDAGHTIGTHTQDHPLSMNRMQLERASKEIDDGIASVKAALGDDADASLAPFFRIPGLNRSDAVEKYLAEKGIQLWSADFLADDWRHISSQRVYDLAIKRIEARKKGILLLHDIQPRTVAALPRILNELKARGYRIVHVVPATSDRPTTPTEPEQWRLHPDDIIVAHWPKVPNLVIADTVSLPAPGLSDFGWPAAAASAQQAIAWPEPSPSSWPASAAALDALPVPAQSLFEMPDRLDITLRHAALASRHRQGSDPGLREAGLNEAASVLGSAHRLTRGRVRIGRASRHEPRSGSPSVAGRRAPAAAPGHRPLGHLVQAKKKRSA